jgi:hypothetical protein
MNSTGKNEGFTLIEIIVGINIAFLAITLIISIYLILNKIYITGAKRIEDKFSITLSLNHLNNHFKKEKYFSVFITKDSLIIEFASKGKVVFANKEVNIKDMNRIEDFNEYLINIGLTNQEVIQINSENISIKGIQKSISSFEIDFIEILLKKNRILYRSLYKTPIVSDRRLINI